MSCCGCVRPHVKGSPLCWVGQAVELELQLQDEDQDGERKRVNVEAKPARLPPRQGPRPATQGPWDALDLIFPRLRTVRA
jgi:hypothetical protein